MDKLAGFSEDLAMKYISQIPAKGVVVIIHGAMEHHGRYKWLIDEWNASGFHVVTGDLPGQGTRAGNTSGHIQQFDVYLQTVKSWLQTAREFELPITLFGHSMGGLIAIRLLEEEKLPIDCVVLSSPCVGLVHKPNTMLNLISQVINKVYPRFRMESGIAPELATRNIEVIENDQNDPLYITKVSVRWYREMVAAMTHALNQVNHYPNVPSLIMQGDDDRIVDKSAVAKWFEACPAHDKEFVMWDNCYHEIFNEPERADVFRKSLQFVIEKTQSKLSQ